MSIVKVTDNVIIGNKRLVLLGGPCMAESQEVCLETADFLSKLCAKLDIGYVFKASYDKAVAHQHSDGYDISLIMYQCQQ
jgi:2-dehydro-3-deoxyphosphooctonate aldolase (KDO 8-P synthase)